MRLRITALLFGAHMPFILCPKSRAEISTFTIWGSLGKIRLSKRVPRTSCAIRWAEGSGAGEMAGAITAKPCSNGGCLAPMAYAPGPPPTAPDTPFDPLLADPRLAPPHGG